MYGTVYIICYNRPFLDDPVLLSPILLYIDILIRTVAIIHSVKW